MSSKLCEKKKKFQSRYHMIDWVGGVMALKGGEGSEKVLTPFLFRFLLFYF